MTLRRLDSVLEPTKAEVIARNTELDRIGIVNKDPVLCSVSDHQFYNTSPLTFTRLLDDPPYLADKTTEVLPLCRAAEPSTCLLEQVE